MRNGDSAADLPVGSPDRLFLADHPAAYSTLIGAAPRPIDAVASFEARVQFPAAMTWAEPDDLARSRDWALPELAGALSADRSLIVQVDGGCLIVTGRDVRSKFFDAVHSLGGER